MFLFFLSCRSGVSANVSGVSLLNNELGGKVDRFLEKFSEISICFEGCLDLLEACCSHMLEENHRNNRRIILFTDCSRKHLNAQLCSE